jgi:hypothetical protein
MQVVNLYRMMRSDQGTRGILVAGSYWCHTIELPWRDNQRNISCIPAGSYEVGIRLSPKYGEIYHIMKVPDRTFILAHSGNWAGDINKGFKTHTNGCILLGAKQGLLQNQWAVLNSRITIRKFMEVMNKEPFRLVINEAF